MGLVTRSSLLAFFSIVTLCSGCFGPGHLVTSPDLAYRDPAVRWVFSTGWQTRFQFLPTLYNPLSVPGIVKNKVVGLKAGRSVGGSARNPDCVIIIEEDDTGSFNELTFWRHKVALRLDNGKSVFATPAGQPQCTCEHWCGEDEPPPGSNESCVNSRTGISFASRWYSSEAGGPASSELLIGKCGEPVESFKKLLAFTPRKGTVYLWRAHLLWLDDGKLAVIGTRNGYVICVDVGKAFDVDVGP